MTDFSGSFENSQPAQAHDMAGAVKYAPVENARAMYRAARKYA